MISKPNSLVNNLHFIIYSNENTTSLTKLGLKYFNKHIGLDNINISVVSNNFLDTTKLVHTDKVNYITPNVEFSSGGYHFVPVMEKILSKIQEEYIFFFCEDYMLTKNVDVDSLNTLMRFIKNEKVDLISFSSFIIKQANLNFKVHENLLDYGFEIDSICYTDPRHLHVYSVQPCIWKKSSLQELLSYNKDISLHLLDTSCIRDKKGNIRNYDGSKGILGYPYMDPESDYGFKNLCTKYNIFDYGWPPEYFIFNYIEMVRHGKFHANLGNENWVQKIINQIIKENTLKHDPDYDRYF